MDYNCCTNGKLPDMSEFISLEVNAVYPFGDPDGDTYCEALFGVASNKARAEDYLDEESDLSQLFFTVYGRNSAGEAEALHDESCLEEIMAVANDLSSRFNLELLIN